MVEMELVAEPGDINTAYLEALNNLKMRKPLFHPVPRLPSVAEKEQTTRDYYTNVRTNVSLVNSEMLAAC